MDEYRVTAAGARKWCAQVGRVSSRGWVESRGFASDVDQALERGLVERVGENALQDDSDVPDGTDETED